MRLLDEEVGLGSSLYDSNKLNPAIKIKTLPINPNMPNKLLI